MKIRCKNDYLISTLVGVRPCTVNWLSHYLLPVGLTITSATETRVQTKLCFPGNDESDQAV